MNEQMGYYYQDNGVLTNGDWSWTDQEGAAKTGDFLQSYKDTKQFVKELIAK